jgi:pyruvate kinase
MKTKIIATCGPSSELKKTITDLINSGVNCFRFNLKHGQINWHQQKIRLVKNTGHNLAKPVAVLIDLQGPEIRIGKLKNDEILLKKDQLVTLAAFKQEKYKNINFPNQKVLKKLKKDITVFLDDAFIELKIIKKIKTNVALAKVIEGGVLKSKKGVNIPGLKLDFSSLTKRDLKALDKLKYEKIDFVALSFVRDTNDLELLKKELKKRNIRAFVIAKIETGKAIKQIKNLIKASDAIMIARGDLAVEFAFEKVPFIQKKIINLARQQSKPVIVATHMLKSMVFSKYPSRAETSDVANAVYDSTDCLMLSEETASGHFPVKSVKVMAKIADFNENKYKTRLKIKSLTQQEAITQSAYDFFQTDYAKKDDIKKLIVLTETGKGAFLLSRLRPNFQIFAISRNKKTVNKLRLAYGINPYYFKYGQNNNYSFKKILAFLKHKKLLQKNEKMVLLYGPNWSIPHQTSTIQLQTV